MLFSLCGDARTWTLFSKIFLALIYKPKVTTNAYPGIHYGYPISRLMPISLYQPVAAAINDQLPRITSDQQ